MATEAARYLLVVGEREALAWILQTSRMAFPPTTRREVDSLVQGDELFITTTRGCFHNPGRDATRIIGTATVTSDVLPLEPVVRIASREFPRGCNLDVTSLAPYLTGVELAPLVPRLDAFVDKHAWGMRLRRPLVPLSARDADLIGRHLGELAQKTADVKGVYLDRIKPVATGPKPSAGAN